MRRDDEIERLLEDWLEEEARPMPHHVLEAGLEAVTRTTQVRRGISIGLPWLNQRLAFAVIGSAVLVVVVIVGPGILRALNGIIGPQPGAGPSASPTVRLLWRPGTDFRLPPDQQNPSPDRYGNTDVWSYLRSATNSNDPSTYFPLPNFDVDQASWYERDLVNLGVGPGPGLNVIDLHGWSSGIRIHNHDAIVGWRSPIRGTVTIRGTAWAGSSNCPEPADGPTFTVQLDGRMLAIYPLRLGESRSIDVVIEVEPGQTVYFSNDPGLDARCDTLRLRLTIATE